MSPLKNGLVHDTIKGQMTEMKRGGGRRRRQFLGDLRNEKLFGAKGGSWR